MKSISLEEIWSLSADNLQCYLNICPIWCKLFHSCVHFDTSFFIQERRICLYFFSDSFVRRVVLIPCFLRMFSEVLAKSSIVCFSQNG